METFLRQHQVAESAASSPSDTSIANANPGNRNFFIWSSGNLYYGGNTTGEGGGLLTLDSPAAVRERTMRLEAVVEGSTFCVQKENLVRTKAVMANGANESTNDEKDDDDKNSKNVEEDIEEGHSRRNNGINNHVADGLLDLDDPNIELVLHVENGEAVRTSVPGVCAICLCPYEAGDQVTYSQSISEDQDGEAGPNSAQTSTCTHAFHKECIVQWLAKKNEARPECPCCRRPFCSVAPLTTTDLMRLAPQGSSVSATRNSAIPTPLNLVPFVALRINENFPASGGDTNMNDSAPDQQRMMVILPNPDMVAFRDGYSG